MPTCHILHFSPTGGVERVAHLVGETVAQTLGMEAIPCDLAAPHVVWPEFAAGDVVLLAAPVYGGRLPGFLAARLEELRPLTEGKQLPAIALVVYGNRAFEDALLELADKATACGLLVMAGMSAVAEHSMCRSVAAGRPDAEDAATLCDLGRQAAEHLRAAPVPAPRLPGQRPYRQWQAMQIAPTASVACTACGLCAARCPAQAIDPAQPQTSDRERCILCMRCVKICPAHARALPAPVMALLAEKLGPCLERRETPALYL